ncbi:hypothetical protein [Bacillus solimangrovi]|uniref:Uncharacterized protein n=1 Tax=Bacillus solimangrovi TaxID=1305675 RepID=A0A1E5LAE5_9BACI|nr:hypothetical protein [Bacillus solimangrovi]OEH91066.1 hypothetical protein BFG57_06750 [Bacillus solimangrovi]
MEYDFDSWDTILYQNRGSDNVYKIKLYGEDGKKLATKTIIQNEADESIDIIDNELRTFCAVIHSNCMKAIISKNCERVPAIGALFLDG